MAFIPIGEQVAIVHGESSALVLAGPGRGKTAAALAAVALWLERYPNGRALFTSFSNAAVRRLAAACELPAGPRMQFRTFHSVAMEVLSNYGRFVGICGAARALDKMAERMTAAECGWPSVTDPTYEVLLAEHARATGQIPFSLMVPWATTLLGASATLRLAVSSQYPLIVVDEFQDTSAEQWEFLKLIGENSRVLALGDEHQMIYGNQFQATLERFQEFEQWKSISRTSITTPSFRCANAEILQFADDVLYGRKTRAAGSGLSIWGVYRKQVRAKLASLWSKFSGNPGANARLAFLVPSARKGEELMDALGNPDKKHAVPIPIRPRLEGDESRSDAFALLAYAAADYVSDRTDETMRRLAIAIETCVALNSRVNLSGREIEQLFAVKSRAVSPLRDLLRDGGPPPDPVQLAPLILDAMQIEPRFATAAKSIGRHGSTRVPHCEKIEGSWFQGYRASRLPRLDGFVPAPSRTTLVSMHRCKGREFEYVIAVVDPHAHRADADIGELRRLHYVAATRAKRWLGIVYVKNDLGPVLQPVLG